jgi:hypothetical protein
MIGVNVSLLEKLIQPKVVDSFRTSIFSLRQSAARFANTSSFIF